MTKKQREVLREALDACCCDAGVFGTYHEVPDFLERLKEAGYELTLKRVKH